MSTPGHLLDELQGVDLGDQLTRDQALAVTTKIQFATAVAWDLIVVAYRCRAWKALGYDSWDEYCTKEFDTCLLRLPREERTEVVSSLRESGLSIRAIASAAGVDKNTVQSDLTQVSEIHTPERVLGPDGKHYPPKVTTPAPEPHQPRRRQITDEFQREVLKLFPRIGRIRKLANDDRVPRNREALASYRGTLIRLWDALDEAITQLDGAHHVIG